VAAAVCAALCSGGGAASAAALASGTWAKAEQVPGTKALNTGGYGVTQSVSCASAGNCAAAGYYTHGPVDQDAFVVNETNGTWGSAQETAAALNTDGGAAVDSVSCASAGNCSAGGYYTGSSKASQAFVVDETNGKWGAAAEVAGALNKGIGAQINSVSCASAGNCGAGGYYTAGPGHAEAFVISEKNGAWGAAKEVAGALNNKDAQLISVSCGSAGDCSAAGFYTGHSGHIQAFVVDETGGVWGSAEQVPGTAALSKGGSAGLNSVSCASAGNCSAGGSYAGSSGVAQAFVVDEKSGTWGDAQEVPGIAALNKGGNGAEVSSVSCASAGNCSAGGQYTPAHAGGAAFVVDETSGVWGRAEEVPGSGTLNQGGLAGISSVSCASAGNCSAGGFYSDGSNGQQALVVGETNGVWGSAEEVPGSAALNPGGRAAVESVSCGSVDHCGAGGEYLDDNFGQQAFVDTES
jgi:hypothetical protein